MKPNISIQAQCSDVRPSSNAHSHITPESGTSTSTLFAHTSLKALAGAVLARTTLHTLPAHCADGAHIVDQAALARLVQLCGERYGFTEAEHAEALATALANPVDALTCFRSIADQLGIVLLSKDAHRCPQTKMGTV